MSTSSAWEFNWLKNGRLHIKVDTTKRTNLVMEAITEPPKGRGMFDFPCPSEPASASDVMHEISRLERDLARVTQDYSDACEEVWRLTRDVEAQRSKRARAVVAHESITRVRKIDGWRCECSCGWVSSSYADQNSAAIAGIDHRGDYGSACRPANASRVADPAPLCGAIEGSAS